jgi:SP family galactose:H+ symporter-like MFS transporter
LSSASAAILASVGVGVINVVLTVVAMQLIDRVGRRPLLLISLAGMALSLFVLGGAFLLPQFKSVLGWIAVGSLMTYVGFFAVGLGPVFWLILSEIYPLRIRGRAMSVGTIANWLSNLIVALTFLTLTQVIGKPGTFWLYAAVSVGAWFFAFFLVPETKGKTSNRLKRTGERVSVRGRCKTQYEESIRRITAPHPQFGAVKACGPRANGSRVKSVNQLHCSIPNFQGKRNRKH